MRMLVLAALISLAAATQPQKATLPPLVTLTEMPGPGPARDFLLACQRAALRATDLGDATTAQLFAPAFQPLPADRRARYRIESTDPATQYAYTVLMFWTKAQPWPDHRVTVSCEAPFDPAMPAFPQVFLTVASD